MADLALCDPLLVIVVRMASAMVFRNERLQVVADGYHPASCDVSFHRDFAAAAKNNFHSRCLELAVFPYVIDRRRRHREEFFEHVITKVASVHVGYAVRSLITLK